MRFVLVTAASVAVLVSVAGCKESSTTNSTTSTGASATSGAGAASSTPQATGAASAAPTEGAKADLTAPMPGEKTMAGGLRYSDTKVGDGSIADAGMTAMVHYTGWLADGTKFDSSLDRGQPFSFRIGAAPPEVITGWDQGVRGMRVGGKRKLIIPAEMGYGSHGAGGVIPPNATLVFDVELLGLK
jgi:FKBP-type peptidyl-prolyl cis-trans isomerase